MAEIAAVKVSCRFFNDASVLFIDSSKKNPAEAGFFKFISYETSLVGEARNGAWCDIYARTTVAVIIRTAVEALNARGCIVIFDRNSPEARYWQTNKAMTFNRLTQLTTTQANARPTRLRIVASSAADSWRIDVTSMHRTKNLGWA